MNLPLLPKWNIATDDLDSGDFAQRARDFERSLLPQGILFPLAGQVWTAIEDCEVDFMAWYGFSRHQARPFEMITPPPVVPCGKARFKQGERVRIQNTDDLKRPLYVHFVPVRYSELENTIVPETYRQIPGYSHYELSLRSARPLYSFPRDSGSFFSEVFRPVKSAA